MRRLDEMKSEVMSIVAHDARTPLRSIRFYAEIPADGFDVVDPAALRLFLERIVSQADRPFRKFSQIGGGPAGRPRGTGLGLVVAGEIVGPHGGRIGVESKPGKGSRFHFSVPVSSPPSDRDAR